MATVDEIIDEQKAQINTVSLLADSFLQQLLLITNVDFSDGFNIDALLPDSYHYADVPYTAFPLTTVRAPSIPTAIAAAPVPEETTFSSVGDIVVPDLAAVAPVLDIPVPPSAALPTAPGASPEFIAPDIPSAPMVVLPTVPTFESLTLPTSPSINLPAFGGVLPLDDLVTPTTQFQFFEAAYESTLLDPLKAKLLNDLTNGGYGIDTNDEAALFQRARDREVEAMLGRVDDAGRAVAARGFPLPPGALSVQFDRAQQDMQNKVSSVSREIFVDSAKRFVDNRQFTIREVKDVEQILIGFHNSVQERALNAARAAVELSVVIFNTLRERYIARLEAYKAEAAAFADRIRGELAKAEFYRTQMEGVNLQVQYQRQLVETYLAQLRGVEVSVSIFRTQMDAASVRAGIERTKLDAYRSQVEAYTSQIQAKVAEFGMYRARIEGQAARVNIYETEVRAHSSQVSAAKVRSDIQLGKLQSEVEQARVKLANFQAQMSGYDADVRRITEGGKLQVDIFRSNIDLARLINDGNRANSELALKAVDQTVQQNTQISQLAINNAQAKLLATVEALKFRTAATQYGTEKFYAVLTALTSTINTLAVQTATE